MSADIATRCARVAVFALLAVAAGCRTVNDVIVDYRGEQFVVELKVWYGRARHEEGEEQLRGYLEHFGLDVGYMLSFNFNRRKEPGLRRVPVGDKVLWEETL